MLVYRRRLWPNIIPIVGQRSVPAGKDTLLADPDSQSINVLTDEKQQKTGTTHLLTYESSLTSAYYFILAWETHDGEVQVA